MILLLLMMLLATNKTHVWRVGCWIIMASGAGRFLPEYGRRGGAAPCRLCARQPSASPFAALHCVVRAGLVSSWRTRARGCHLPCRRCVLVCVQRADAAAFSARFSLIDGLVKGRACHVRSFYLLGICVREAGPGEWHCFLGTNCINLDFSVLQGACATFWSRVLAGQVILAAQANAKQDG